MIEISSAEAHCLGIDITVQRECIFLVMGGKLIERYWRKPEDDDENLPYTSGKYMYAEVEPHETPRHAFSILDLGVGVRMVDVFHFMINNPLYQPFVGHYCLEHARNGIDKFIPLEELDGDIEFMEVYDMESLTDHETYYMDDTTVLHERPLLEGCPFPSFHGIGHELKEDMTPEQGGFKKGERIPWGIMASKAETLAALPLVLNEHFKVFDDRNFVTSSKVQTVLECTKKYTLLEVLKAIFWEMSWYGGPEDIEGLEDDAV